MALRDLEEVLHLDADDDGAITWGELRAAEPDLAAYATERLQIGDTHRWAAFRPGRLLVARHSDGAYAVLEFVVEGLEHPSEIEIRYRALFDLDSLHRGLLRLEWNGTTRVAIFSPSSNDGRYPEEAPAAARWPTVFLREGVYHIWSGYDHLLFLIVLLLPVALRRSGGEWEPRPRSRAVIADILKTVTAFTLAHSLTLALAGLGWVRLPSRLVESVIAASILVAAAHNLRPFFPGGGWVMAFGFGLIHGFGFANALTDLGVTRSGLVPALLGFNLGVEVGQLAIVVLFLPLILGLRHRACYRRYLMPIGSLAIAMLATVWLAERGFAFGWFGT